MFVVTVERFKANVSRLYEQGATDSRIGENACRWLIWVNQFWMQGYLIREEAGHKRDY